MSDILTPIRVSELPEVTTAADSDYLVIDNGTQTSRITSENYNATASESAKHYANEALLSAQNAELQAGAASDSADAAENKAQEANASAQDAEAWAVGKRAGQDVPSTDDAYHNNAKYFAGQAHTSATEAADSADTATEKATEISAAAAQIETNTEDIADLKSAIEQIEPGLSDAAKVALLHCFQKVAWIDEHGQTYYDALESALYAGEYPKITAVFDPGANVIYTDDTLNSLKQYLTVEYFENRDSDGVIIAASNYTLSGMLVEGISTVVVSYDELSTTFIINGVIDFYNIQEWSLSNGLLQVNQGNIVSERLPVLTTNQNAAARALVTCLRGYENPIYDYATSQLIVPNRFPIPVPEGARSVVINAPSGYGIVCGIYQFVDGNGYSLVQSGGSLPQKEATVKLNVSGRGYFIPLLLTVASGASLPASVKVKYNFDWDYEWHSSSGAVPTGMTYSTEYTPTFDSETGMRILRPELVFNNAGQNCELEVEMKYDETASLGSGSPFVGVASVFTEQANNIAYIRGFSDSSITNIQARYNDDAEIDTGLYQSNFHVFNIKLQNGTYSIAIDGNSIGSGTGDNRTEYMVPTGIHTNGVPRAYVYIKSIKYRLI